VNGPMFAPCETHQALLRMEFERAIAIARECGQCYIEEACS
jgi:hypothetical protein